MRRFSTLSPYEHVSFPWCVVRRKLARGMEECLVPLGPPSPPPPSLITVSEGGLWRDKGSGFGDGGRVITMMMCIGAGIVVPSSLPL